MTTQRRCWTQASYAERGESMLVADQISKTYREKSSPLHAVSSTSLTLEDGKRYALVGESGSGKTTLARMLTGITRPSGGTITWDRQDVFSFRDRRELYRKIQLVFQDAASSLNPQMTVYDLIAEPLRNLLSLSGEAEREKVNMLMERMCLPPELSKRKPRELSGGQQKRVSIARAIGVDPALMILDEAISGLDVILRKEILELLSEFQKETDCSFLLITHDIDVALFMADTIFVMKDGSLIERVHYDGNTECFKHEYSRRLLYK